MECQVINKSQSFATAIATGCLALLMSHATSASAQATSSGAALDWTSFRATTNDLGFAFLADSSYGTTVTAFTQAFAPDATSAIAAGNAGLGLSATADSKTLAATIASLSGQGYVPRSADVNRTADFLLDNNSSVTFSINGTVSTSDGANAGTTSFAGLSVLGGDLGYYLSSLGLTANGALQSQNGLLSVTVTNTSGSAIVGFLDVEGTVNVAQITAVPEPATASLLLVGLAMGGFLVVRRRRD